VLVTFGRHKVAAHYIAVYLATGAWPAAQVRFKDDDKQNLAFPNLELRADGFSQTEPAVRSRYYRQRRKENARQVLEAIREANGSAVAGVHYDKGDMKWVVTDPAQRNRVRAVFPDSMVDAQRKAELFQYEFNAAVELVHANPPPALRAHEAKLTAGPTGFTLEVLHALLCYDPDTGHFYYREHAGQLRAFPRADRVNTRKHATVTIGSRQYPAGMLAWFLTYREWPPRKSIAFADGNPRNVSFGNLLLRE